MILQVGVKILLKNKEGKFLLLLRNPKKYPEVGPKWDLPGGRINIGTPLLENLKREIKEEVGLEYIGAPKLVAAQDILVHRYLPAIATLKALQAGTDSTDTAKEIVRHVVRLTYIGEIEGESVVDNNDNDENLEAKWMSAEEIMSLDKTVLDSYFQELIKNQIIKL